MSDIGEANAEAETGEPLQLTKTKLVLVEGKDEVFFFGAMLRHLKKTGVQIMECGGKEGLVGTLKGLKKDPLWPSLEAIVVVRDADFPLERSKESGATAAWRSVTGALRDVARVVPPKGHGTLEAAPDEKARAKGFHAARAAVYIAPDGERDGMLEDLCLSAVAGDPAMTCVDGFFQCLDGAGVRFKENRAPKARAHAFLASREVPDLRVGEAALKGYWPWDAPAFAVLLELIRSL